MNFGQYIVLLVFSGLATENCHWTFQLDSQLKIKETRYLEMNGGPFVLGFPRFMHFQIGHLYWVWSGDTLVIPRSIF